jgi:predicted Zn-dependent protease
MRRWILAVMAVAAAGLAALSCQTNPTTGRSQFLMMSREEEIRIGTEAKPEMVAEFGGEVDHAGLRSYLTDLGMRLKETTAQDDPAMAALPWEFTLLNSDVVNAFALPGGKIFLTRGLGKEMTNEAQLAAVLGHEIGHVTARHSNERAGQAVGTTLIGAAVGAAIGAAVNKNDRGAGAAVGAGAGAAAGGIWALAYSRDQEIEADRLGARYMTRLGYDPQGAVEVQQILKRLSEKGGARPPEFLSTHPASDTRINELRKRIQKYYQDTAGNPAFVKNEDRFRVKFLAPLSTLPPPPQPPARRASGDGPDGGSARGLLASAVLGDPAAWCGVCAAQAAARH